MLVCAKFVNFLLDRFYGYTYYGALGFIVGSLPAIYPGFSFNLTGVISLLLLVVGFSITYFFNKFASVHS